jgi:hypothetical protein
MNRFEIGYFVGFIEFPLKPRFPGAVFSRNLFEQGFLGFIAG